MQLKLHGAILSPWVRRLALTLEEKDLAYELIPVVPLGEPDPEFLKISPLGKVPVLEVDGRFLPDSLAGCAFLEDLAPSPALFPDDSWDRAWMLWLCDFLGAGLFSKVEAPLFVQRVINPNFLKKEADAGVIAAALDALPRHFDYLEGQLGDGAFLVGEQLSLADLTAGSVFMNMRHADAPVDAATWPRLASYVDRLHARASFQRILEIERGALGAISPVFAAA
ncbi:MAG: glutathione S-transferase family protein [Pseudomonadota bacterium]